MFFPVIVTFTVRCGRW